MSLEPMSAGDSIIRCCAKGKKGSYQMRTQMSAQRTRRPFELPSTRLVNLANQRKSLSGRHTFLAAAIISSRRGIEFSGIGIDEIIERAWSLHRHGRSESRQPASLQW